MNKISENLIESRKQKVLTSSYLAWKLSACFPVGGPNQMNEHTHQFPVLMKWGHKKNEQFPLTFIKPETIFRFMKSDS